MPTTTVSSSNLWFNRSFIILQSLKQFSVTTSVNVFNATSVAAEKINELFISFLSAYLFNLPLNQPSFFCFFFFSGYSETRNAKTRWNYVFLEASGLPNFTQNGPKMAQNKIFISVISFCLD